MYGALIADIVANVLAIPMILPAKDGAMSK